MTNRGTRDSGGRCPADARWIDYVDGEVREPVTRAALRAHLSGCDRCRAIVTSFREVDSTLRAADPSGSGPIPAESFLAAVKRRGSVADATLSNAPHRRRMAARLARYAGFATAAAILAAAAALLLVSTRSSPSGGRSPDAGPLASGPSRAEDTEPAGVTAPPEPTLDRPLPPGIPDADEAKAYDLALASLRESIRDAAAAGSARVRRDRVDAARAILRGSPALAPRLFEGLTPDETLAALDAAAGSRDPLLVPDVVRLAESMADPAAAIETLASMRSRRALSALAGLALRPGAAGRAAIGALARSAPRDPAASAHLFRIARDPSARERAAALEAVAASSDPAAGRLLAALVADGPLDAAVVAAAASRRDSIVPALEDSFVRARGAERERLLAALEALAGQGSLAFLERHAARGGPFAVEAARILARIDGDASLALVLRIRTQSSPEAREACRAAIAARGTGAIPFLEKALDSDPLAAGAVEALADTGLDEALPALSRALGRPDLAPRAADAIARMPGEAAVAILASRAADGPLSSICRRALEGRGDASALGALALIRSAGGGPAAPLGNRLEPGARTGRGALDRRPHGFTAPRPPVVKPGAERRPAAADRPPPRGGG